jgi:Tfp pilus assembly pilus retraction ATPase PilT
MNFDQLLKIGVDQGASAIHLQAEASPQVRIGRLIRNVEGPSVKAEELKAFIASIGPKSVADDIDRSLAVGSIFSTSIAAGRFRCSTFSQIRGPGLVLRVITSTIPTLEELNLPGVVREFYYIEGRQGGMQSLDQHLIELNQAGVISGTETMRLATNPEAVAVGLRALRQVNTASVPAATNLVGSDKNLLP